MDAKEYHKQAMRTAAGLSKEEQVINAMLGLIGEVGEIAQIVDTRCVTNCDVSRMMFLAEIVGGMAEKIKKHLYHGHALDKASIERGYQALEEMSVRGSLGIGIGSREGYFIKEATRETGDVIWYAALACETQGVTINDAMQINIDKLLKRYPRGFSADASQNRSEGDEG